MSFSQQNTSSAKQISTNYDVVVIGGGTAGIAATASLLKRDQQLNVAILDPATHHYYQPGWTLVGAGVFSANQTCKPMADVIPQQATWINKAVTLFKPENNQVVLEDGNLLSYKTLIIAAGIKLNWESIKGLPEALGSNGITSNYAIDYAPYTWQLVSNFTAGRAIFTQPPLPIKCAGAPQKALYLSADHWLKQDHLKNIDIEFYNAGDKLFAVKEYVPALMEYMDKYHASIFFHHKLIEVDANNKIAFFELLDSKAEKTVVGKSFDFLHVCPPQLFFS